MSFRQETVASLWKHIEQEYVLNKPTLPPITKQSDESPKQKDLIRLLSDRSKQSSQSEKSNPWKFNSRYFDSVHISKLACLKILEHAIRGGNIEVMGMLVGCTMNNQFVIFDCYELPVEGTETRVNAQSESYEYMVQYVNEMVPDSQNIVGWYHSHPGYDCWLSNIDMHTQNLNQNYQDPYVGIVVDPIKSSQEGKLAIGAFRTVQNQSAQGADENALLQFYDLNISVFDSDLNLCLQSTKLNFKKPNLILGADALLLNRLVEIIRQWHNFNETPRKSHPQKKKISTTSFSNEEEEEIHPTSAEDDQLTRQSRQMDIYRRQTRSSSLVSITTSADDDSDVDMDGRHLGDMESVSSSIHTMTESTLPLRGSTQTPLHTLRRPWNHAMELVFQPQTEIRDENDSDGVQNDALLMDYEANKKELLGLKMKEYKKLRFFRDAFTL